MSQCSIEDCDRVAHARGWCSMHYQRWQRHGDPLVFIDPRRPLGGPEDDRHGTANGYTNLECRCERCTAAWADKHREYMHAKPERLATHALRERLKYAAKKRSDA